ncbi:MAG: toxin-activating lysine-acyltransferase [Stellaceae bacterium]
MPEGRAAEPGAKPPAVTVDAIVGQVVLLMMAMPAYRHVFLTDLEWMVLPPILLNQYRFFRAENRTVAFAAWACLSEAAEARLQEPNPRLAPADWKSGDRLWLVNLFAPFGHHEPALKELRETALEGRSFKMHRRGADGKVVVETFGEYGGGRCEGCRLE